MKRREIVLAGLADAAAIACGMLAAVCAVPTAFGINFSVTLLVVFCVLGALLLSFWLNIKKYGFGFGALFLATVILIVAFQSRLIADGAIVFFCRVWDMLPNGLTKAFDFSEWMLQAESVIDPAACVTSFLMLLAAGFGLLLAPATTRSRAPLLSILIPLPPLLLSLLYTDQQPAFWVLLLLTLFCGYAMIGSAVRRGDSPHRGAFSAGILTALAALMLLILAAAPKSRYVPIPEEQRQSFFSDRFGELADEALRWFGKSNPNEYDLTELGNREEDTSEAFRVRSTRTGTYLLRTHSYGAYENGQWKHAEAYTGAWRSMEALGERQENAVSILSVSESISNERIVPYAFLADGVKTDESTVRANGLTAYSWTFKQEYSVIPGNVTEEERSYYAYALRSYTMPDGAERYALLKIAEDAGIRVSDDAYETALRTAAFVCSAGTYTLTPGEAPDSSDFILYFLTEAHRGYCVHFASATTAMLQAMGIPARYTVGYHVTIPEDATADSWFTVTEQAAHAWAEVYVLGVGWVPIESTPGFGADRSEADGSQTHTGMQAVVTPVPTPAPVMPGPTETTEETPQPTEEPTLAPIKPDFSAAPMATQTPDENEPEGSGGTVIGMAGNGTAGHALRWLLIPLLPLVWIGIGLLIRRRREAAFRRADTKRAIPDMAHYLARLERFGIEKDPDAEEWAQEAVFSDHKMKAQQKELLRRVHAAQRAVYANAPLRRFLLRWVLYRI